MKTMRELIKRVFGLGNLICLGTLEEKNKLII
jgi:hypothetical protein